MIVKSQIGLGKNLIENSKFLNAFMGVSLGKPFYSKENVEKYFLWAEENCKKFILILADEPEKWNYQVFKQLNKSEALSFARKVGQDYKRGFQRTINKHNLKDVEIKTWKELFQNNNQYGKNLTTIQKHFKENQAFKEDCIKTVWQNLGQKIKEELGSNQDNTVAELLANYLLEELAATLWFTQNNFPIEINPRKLTKINENIYTNTYNQLSKDLEFPKQWGYIQLNIE